MSKTLISCFGDLHWNLATKRPRCRREDYADAIEVKLRWIKSATESQVRGKASATEIIYVCTGDIFHKSRPSLEAVARIARLIKELFGVLYTLAGNHDGPGLRVLIEAGLVKLLENDPVCIDDATGALLGGRAYQAVEAVGNYEASEPGCEILVTHGMLEESAKPWPVTTPAQLAEITLPPVLLNGHNHRPFRFALNGSQVINVGSLARTAVDQTHTPILALIADGVVYVRQIPVESSDTALSRADGLDEALSVVEDRNELRGAAEALVSELGGEMKPERLLEAMRVEYGDAATDMALEAYKGAE